MQPFTAFTVKGTGLLRELKTEANVRPAQSVYGNPDGTFPAIVISAIWDTGATASSLSPSVISRLGLKQIGYTTVCAAGNRYGSGVYLVDVLLPNKLIVKEVRVTEAKEIQGFDMLIGMDIIMLGDLSITNRDGHTVFSFRYPPGEKHIDYVEDATKINNGQIRESQHQFRNRIQKLKRKRH